LALREDIVAQPVCRGYHCASTDLIEAHIVPRGFARDVMGSYTSNRLISIDNVRTTHHGVFDRGILCAACDGMLGDLDNYALTVCRRFRRDRIIRDDGLFELTNVDGDRFATFVLSILWRASVSSRIEVSKVSLGSYEGNAGEIIFGAKPLASLPDYQLLVGRYLRTGKFNPAGNFTYPARMTRELTGWYFALNGFRILAKLDAAPLPAEIGPAIVNANDRLIGSFMKYESTTEGQSVHAMTRELFVRDHIVTLR
jgi:hypothetical protein